MDSQEFLGAFGYIANAPGGIGRLRELILQLAISGKLASQEELDVSVESDLARARILQSEYVDGLELRKSLPHPPISEFAFPIPPHWTWERLERLCLYIQRGKGPIYVDRSSTRVISQKCIQWSGFDLGPSRFISDDAVQGYGPERILRNGDLLWNSTGTGTAGRIAIFDIEETISAVADSHVTVIRLANFEPRYVWCVIAAPWVQTRIDPGHRESLVSGTTQQVELATNAVRALEIPCPPIEEQKRIVAKVDELMALCKNLEKQQGERRAYQTKTRKTIVEAMVSASASGDVLSGWGKLTDHFAELFSSPEDVEDLRALVCGLAVQGLVAEHVTAGQTSSELVMELRELKGQHTSKGSLSRTKPVVPEVFEETSFPSHWTTITLDEAISGIDAGWSPACLSTPRDRDDAWGVLKTTSVQKMSFNSLEHKELPASLEPRAQYELRDGDILVTRAGPKNRVGICCVAKNVPPRLMISDKLIRFHIVGDMVSSDFVAMCITYGETGRILERLKSGMADSQMNISQDKLRSLPIPVPPYLEQLEILKRIQSLMAICDHLQEQMGQESTVAERLATSCVSSITGVAFTEEEAELKAPQTELIAPLRIGVPPSGAAQAPLASILVRHSGSLSARDLWQRFGGEIGSFYAQLKHEVAQGWIVEPEAAEMRERESA